MHNIIDFLLLNFVQHQLFRLIFRLLKHFPYRKIEKFNSLTSRYKYCSKSIYKSFMKKLIKNEEVYDLSIHSEKRFMMTWL